MATVTITNILTKVIADGKEVFAPISPTCVPVPCTPVQEYISDMVTLTDGTLLVPAFKKFRSFQFLLVLRQLLRLLSLMRLTTGRISSLLVLR